MTDPIRAYARAAYREHSRRLTLLARGEPPDRIARDTPLRCRAAEAERLRLLCPPTVVDATQPHK